MNEMFESPKPTLKLNKKKMDKGQSFEVTYPVSYRYNGGITIDGEWYRGYSVPNPDVPEGWKLVSICVGLNLNAHPPYATMLLEKIP